MSGLPCAQKVLSNYGVLAPEATALATPGNLVQQESAALAQAAQACCMSYIEAYSDPFVQADYDAKGKLLAVQRSEGVAAVAFAADLRSLRDHGRIDGVTATQKDTAAAIRAHRDGMVKAFVDVYAELMAEYYPPPAATQPTSS